MSYIRVDLPNTNNKWVEFELTNVDMIHTLTRHEHDSLTQIVTPSLWFLYRSLLSIYENHRNSSYAKQIMGKGLNCHGTTGRLLSLSTSVWNSISSCNFIGLLFTLH